MNHLVDVVLLGACLFYARRLFGKRAVAPPISNPEVRPGTPVTSSAVQRRPKTAKIKVPTARPAAGALQGAPRGYLLGGSRADAHADRTTAMMDMMSGPGVCTPHDR